MVEFNTMAKETRSRYPLSPAEMARLVKLWDRVRWPAPEELFQAHCRNEIAVAVELAVVRRHAGAWQVLLIHRHDKFFRGWHMPGSLLLPGEKMREVFRRLSTREVHGRTTAPKFVTIFEFHSRRGYELSLLHTARLIGSRRGGEGQFFSLGKLPVNTLSHHRTMLAALRRYLRTR